MVAFQTISSPEVIINMELEDISKGYALWEFTLWEVIDIILSLLIWVFILAQLVI